ncbi:synaptic vesicle glycoprotein 2C-like isoform X2 [Planococcus citri]|uniref:synaptic vesicle glycoprotein 2C-like isoform X2 n=1 Tax=Planococcus citri TaxID=170843 RepID=UPI0031F9FFD2
MVADDDPGPTPIDHADHNGDVIVGAPTNNLPKKDHEQLNNGKITTIDTVDLQVKDPPPPTNGKFEIVENGQIFDAVDFERAIELAGYGKFHYFLLVICGFVSTSEEMDVISMSFILPSAQCDLSLDTHSKGWLNSIIFIGMMAGAYMWGSLADTLGRRKVLIVISFTNAICIIASTFAQSYSVFMLFRFLNGAALGGSGPVIWSYFAEFQPKLKRGSMLSSMAAFWTLGNLFVASLAWIIIPQTIGHQSQYFTYKSWQIFLALCSIPSFIVAVLLLYLPESPKFLLTQNQHEKAMKVFQRIYQANTGNEMSSYPARSLIIENKTTTNKMPSVCEGNSRTHLCKVMLGGIIENTRQLFIPPILRYTLISITINLTFHIGYYGLMMWFPELFNRFDEYSKAHNGLQNATVCQVTEYITSTKDYLNSTAQDSFCTSSIAGGVFLESFITVAAALPSNILAVLGMDKLGRKFFLVFSTISSGACAIIMSFIVSKTQNLIVSATFSSVISCGNAALDCLITEIFPTNLRATGVAISMVAARFGGIIGNIVIATLLDLYCPAPTFIVAFLLISGGLMCLFLPNTTREPLS